MPEVRYKGFNGREAMQRDAEWTEFLQLARDEKVGRYLEIGMAYGTTFHSMATHIDAVKVVGVDKPAYSGGPAAIGEVCGDLVGKGIVPTVIFGDSHSVQVVERVRSLGGFDLIFIDADHNYEAVKQDWKLYGQFSRIVAFHDIDSEYHPPNEGTTRLWNEVKQSFGRSQEIIRRPDPAIPDEGFGIGVVWRW